jgi:hypothetical protein
VYWSIGWIGYPALDTNMGANIWFQFGCPVWKRKLIY